MTIEAMLDRISRRGRWQITPGQDGTLVFHWVTRGQWGNPFARAVHIEGSDLTAIVTEAYTKTEPERGDLGSMVYWSMVKRRDRARRIAERMVVR